MRQIFKYRIDPSHGADMPFVDLPLGAVPIHFDAQHDYFCLWAEVDPTLTMQTKVRYQIFPTGAEIPDNAKHVGTWVGACVWHCYEIGVAP